MAIVQTEISLHQVINALESLSYDYPTERLATEQIERITTAAVRLLKRLEEEKEDRRVGLKDRRVKEIKGDNAIQTLFDLTGRNPERFGFKDRRGSQGKLYEQL